MKYIEEALDVFGMRSARENAHGVSWSHCLFGFGLFVGRILSCSIYMEKLATKLDDVGKSVEKLGSKLDDIGRSIETFNQIMDRRLSTIEGWSHNQDLSTEPEITHGIKDFIREYSNQHGFKYTFRTGKNYPSNLRQPENAKKLITNIDGSYILSNDPENSRAQDATRYDDVFFSVDARLKKAAQIINRTSTNARTRNKEISQVKRLTSHTIDLNKHTPQARLAPTPTSLSRDALDTTARYIAVVEAKNCLSNQYILDQPDKMMELIQYFFKTNLYYECKRQNMLETGKAVENWSEPFCKSCELYNMKYNGVVILIGGPYYQKDLGPTFDIMKQQFKHRFSVELARLAVVKDMLEGDPYYVMRSHLHYAFMASVYIDFQLVLTSGSRYDATNKNNLR
jgi:hypothetical protein